MILGILNLDHSLYTRQIYANRIQNLKLTNTTIHIKHSSLPRQGMVKGQIIGGEFGKILLRQKSDEQIELGELMIGKSKDKNHLLQVYGLMFGSQISLQNLELISGLNLEEKTDTNFLDSKLRNYNMALLKSLITMKDNSARVSKSLPDFFSTAREIKADDLKFITKPKNPLFLGKLRSGSKELDVDIILPGEKALSHHILVPATTGRGKSNLTSNILWNTIEHDYCGFLVLDPHDEYWGRNKPGLKDHPEKDRVIYYTNNATPPGARSLKINLNVVKPSHFNGVVYWSDPQVQAMAAYYKKYGEDWITSAILEKPINLEFHEGTISVLKRRLLALLDLDFDGRQIFCNGMYDLSSGKSTIKDICCELINSNTVIIDTSSISGSQEILIGSLVSTEVFQKYKYFKINGKLNDKPVISVVLEEAPRVLGKEVLERGSNIFSTIAREGRKFKVGLFAITQLPSLIPRQILANMNTKIILGIEMGPERQAIIDSAAQDLSTDSQNIASLDIGEALVTSNFTKFATPIKIPFFDNIVKKKENIKNTFAGVKLG